VVSREARWLAAVFAIGSDAALSHQSAAALWGIRPSARERIDVSAPRAVRSGRRIQVHHVDLAADERATHHGIPVTTVARTLLDLAAVLRPRELEKALNEAEIHRLADATSLNDLLSRHHGRKGTKAIRALIDDKNDGATITRSELEDRFLAFLDDAVLPRPKVNATLELGDTTLEVDCLWPDQNLIAELDGHATHATSKAFESDRARDRMLQVQGWRVVRLTWRQVHTEAERLARDLRCLLQLP
jgi:very-short-patch-repair endonuclease